MEQFEQFEVEVETVDNEDEEKEGEKSRHQEQLDDGPLYVNDIILLYEHPVHLLDVHFLLIVIHYLHGGHVCTVQDHPVHFLLMQWVSECKVWVRAGGHLSGD